MDFDVIYAAVLVNVHLYCKHDCLWEICSYIAWMYSVVFWMMESENCDQTWNSYAIYNVLNVTVLHTDF